LAADTLDNTGIRRLTPGKHRAPLADSLNHTVSRRLAHPGISRFTPRITQGADDWLLGSHREKQVGLHREQQVDFHPLGAG